MFDIGFWELALIGVVALLVVGPERLPALARTTGVWVGRARRFIGSVKEDIERELRAEELKQILNKTDEIKDVHEILEETKETLEKSSRELGKDAAESSGVTPERAGPAVPSGRSSSNPKMPAPGVPDSDKPDDRDGEESAER